MQVKTFKRATSFLTALCMSCSIVFSNAEAVFAYSDKAKATIVNESEHGMLAFAPNDFENVYIDSPFETSISKDVVDDVIDETTETQTEDTNSTSEALEDTEIDDANAESSDTEDTVETESIDVTDEVDENTAETEPTEVAQYVRFVDPNSKIINRGQTVIINAYPEDGYSVESIYIVTDSGKAVNYSFNDDVISFTMPGNDVTIRAIFSDTISEFTVDDSLVDNYTYIKSNLDSNYVTLNKWEMINAINVKQTVVDKTVFDNKGIVPTIDNFASVNEDYDYSNFDALINFSEYYMPVFDVDENSDYYVAFVNSMQNDASDVYDYVVAENNDKGIVVDGNSFDANTGILYIKKSNIGKVDEASEESIEAMLSPIQIQLLNVFDSVDSTAHNIDVIVSDDENILDNESGVVSCGQYDDAVNIKLNPTANGNIEVKTDGYVIGSFDLSTDYADDIIAYSCATNTLTVSTGLVQTSCIELTTFDGELYADNTAHAVADWLKSIDAKGKNGPDVIVNSGTLAPGNAITLSDIAFDIGQFTLGNNNYAYGYAGSNDANNRTLIGNIMNNGSTDFGGFDTPDSGTWFTHKIALNSGNFYKTYYNGKKIENSDFTYTSPFTTGFNFNGANITFDTTTYSYFLLRCVHANKSNGRIADNYPTNFNYGESSASWAQYPIYFRILDVTNNTVIYAVVGSYANTQAGVGVYKSNLIKKGSAFTMSKTFDTSELMMFDTYGKAGAKYSLYVGTDTSAESGTVVATFETDDDGVFSTDKVTVTSDYSTVAYTVENGKLIFGKEKSTGKYTLPAGTYTLVETAAPNGYEKNGTSYTFTTVNGECTDISGKGCLTEYPTLVSFVGSKISGTGYVKGTTFDVFYSDKPFTIDTKADATASKTDVTVSGGDGTVYRIAQMVANDGGTLIPTVDIVPADSDGKFDAANSTGTSFFDTPIVSPTTDNQTLTNCPLGYYKFVETLAPTGNNLDVGDGGFVRYYETELINKKRNAGGKALTVLSTGETTTDIYYVKDSAGTRVNVSGQGITFNAENKTASISAQKVLFNRNEMYDSFSNERRNTEYQHDNAYWSAKFEAFKSAFADRYLLDECSYSIYLDRSKEIVNGQLAASGVTLEYNGHIKLADGATDEDGIIIWTLTDEAKLLGFNTFMADDPTNVDLSDDRTYTDNGNAIDGFIKNDRYSIYENYSNKYTNAASYSMPVLGGQSGIGVIEPGTHTFISGNDDAITRSGSTALGNGPDTVAVAATKLFVTLSAGCTLHEGTTIVYSDGETPDKVITADMLTNGEYAVSNDDVAKGAKISCIDNDNNIIDMRAYVKGTKIEIWYDATLDEHTALNASNWPTITRTDTTQTVNASGTKAVRVAVIEYVENNNEVVADVKLDEFKAYTKDGVDTGKTYSGSLGYYAPYGSTPPNLIDLLPYGAYMTIETATARDARITNSSAVQYKYIDVDATNDNFQYSYSVVNNGSTSTDVGIKLTKRSDNGGKVDLSGAEYLVYWSPDKITNNNFGSYTIHNNTATFTPASNVYLVGKFTTLTEYYFLINQPTDVMPHNTYGVVTENLFSGNDWTSLDDTINEQIDRTLNFLIEHTEYLTDSARVAPSSYLTTNKQSNSTKVDTSIYTKFNGPIGHYIVVETKGVTGYNIDSVIHNQYVDTTTSSMDATIKSVESKRRDPVNVKIVKAPDKYGYNFVSTKGTRFKLTFYEGELDINSPTDLANKYPSAVAYYNTTRTKSMTVNGETVNVGEFATNIDVPTYVTNRRYVSDDGTLRFPEGTIVITEYLAVSPYTIRSTDTFKYGTNDFGHTLIYRHYYDANNQLVRQARANNYQTWVNYASSVMENSLTIENGIPSYPFELSKKLATANNVGYVDHSARFKLEAYNKAGTKITKTWEFDVPATSVFNSETNSVFDDVNGKPFYEGSKYTITETSSPNAYLRKPVTFTYKRNMSIADIINGASAGSANTTNKNVFNYSQPQLITYAIDPSTLIKAANTGNTNKLVTIKDTVTVNNIASNNTYIIRGIVADVTDPEHPVFIRDASGNFIRAAAAFNVTSDKLVENNVKVNVNFTFAYDKSIFEGKTLNVYEFLALADDGKTSTYAYDGYVAGTPAKLAANEIPAANSSKQLGGAYVLSARSTTAVPASLNLNDVGTIRNTTRNGYIGHADALDEDQNIHIPSVKTLESDIYTSTHYSSKHDVFIGGELLDKNNVIIVDNVTIRNLPVINKNYIITYTIRDYETNAVLAQDQYKFKSKNANEFVLPLSGLSFVCGDTTKFYVQEQLYSPNGKLLADHTDKVQDQTGYVTLVTGTVATNTDDGTKTLLADANAKVTDTIQYQNFPSGAPMIAYGFLVNKANDTIVAAANNAFTTSASGEGNATVNFTFNATNLANTELVAYEYIYNKSTAVTGMPSVGSKFTTATDTEIKRADFESGHGRLVGSHFDKNDRSQTVYIPSASTNLNGNAKIVPANATMNLVDTITYNNILQGTRVTVYGYLVDMETNKIIAAQRQIFDTPTPAPKTEPAPVSGNIQVVFTVNTSNMANHTISCVEYIYQGNATFTAQTVGSTFSATHAPVSITGGRMIAKHADLADKAQQVKVNDTPKLNVLKTNYAGDPLADATLRIINADTGATVEEWTSITAPHALSADLNVGNYELVEVRAPKGYTIVNPIKFSAVNDTATVNGVSVRTIKLVYTDSPTEELPYTNATIDGNTVKLYTLTMRDPDLAHLPTAGGIGTTVFSVCGMLMMLGGAYFIFKKKEESAE